MVQSPEDKINRQNVRQMSQLHRYTNIKCFDDICFLFPNNEILSANSAILQARCEYFRSMLCQRYNFRESIEASTQVIKIGGIQKSYF